jgi:glycosyltransferase involved in cell wall biosynthesis
MTLDVVIPTHNRARLLPGTLDSLFSAEQPTAMAVAVIVCDNRSTDDTRAVVTKYQERYGERVRYVYEPVPGRSAALNAGIAAANGDLIAMIDDDEEVDSTWLRVIEQVFCDPAVDFIGGPYVPRWTAPPPDWLPSGYGAAIGRVDCGSESRRYGAGFDGMLMGGNAVIRRAVLSRVGQYRTDLGRTPTRLTSCEDEDLFKRLLAAGAAGYYRPDLIIHHLVAPERVRKGYFRRWCFWRGVSLGILDGSEPQPVAYLFGIPRYMFGRAVRAAAANATGWRLSAAERFEHELACWDLFGFLYGRHLEARRQPRSRDDTATRSSVAGLG